MIPIIKLQRVVRSYGEGERAVRALNGVDVTFARGDFASLFGPSGSGKTTLLNIIGGLDRASSGSVSVLDRELTGMSPGELAAFRLRHVGFVFQSFNLIPVLSARENVEFILELQGIDGHERRRRASELLEEVGLSGLEQRRPAELSGGQQQRVAVARAIVSRAPIILADEPTANLDSKTAEGLIHLMRELNRRYQTTFIFSTHDPLVMRNASRLIQIKDGAIVSDSRGGEEIEGMTP